MSINLNAQVALFETVWTSQMETTTIGRPERVWEGPEDKKQICLLSDDVQFLREAFTLIMEYTKKIDPRAPINCSIELIDNPSLGLKGFKHGVFIHDILSRSMNVFYGFNDTNSHSNCHGSALMAAGVIPAPIHCSSPSPFFDGWVSNKLQKIPLDQIENGDLVFINKGDDSHSFVFLSHALCISMNGRGHNLEIHPTSEVLEHYGCSADALKGLSEDDIRIYRRTGSMDYLEEMMPDLMEYYKHRDGISVRIDEHPHYSLIAPFENKFSDFMKSAKKNPLLDEDTKNAIKFAYWNYRGGLIGGAASKPYDWEKREEKAAEAEAKKRITVIAGVALAFIAFGFIGFQS